MRVITFDVMTRELLQVAAAFVVFRAEGGSASITSPSCFPIAQRSDVLLRIYARSARPPPPRITW